MDPILPPVILVWGIKGLPVPLPLVLLWPVWLLFLLLGTPAMFFICIKGRPLLRRLLLPLQLLRMLAALRGLEIKVVSQGETQVYLWCW